MNSGATSTTITPAHLVWAVAVGAALLHLLIMPWGRVPWGDGLEFVAVASHLGIAHPSGYPLFTLLGWLFLHLPFAEPYDAVLLLCRLALVAVPPLVLLTTLSHAGLTGRDSRLEAILYSIGAVAFSAGFLAVSASLSVEVYTVNAALLGAIVWLLTKDVDTLPAWRLLLAGILQGLAAANHLTSLCTVPLLLFVCVAWTRAHRRFWIAPSTFVLFLVVPAVLYGTLLLRVDTSPDAHGIYWDAPDDAGALLEIVRGGEYRHFRFLAQQPGTPFSLETYMRFLLGRSLLFLGYLGAIFFGLGPTSLLGGLILLAAMAAGIHAVLKSSRTRLSIFGVLLAAALQILFTFTYNIVDIDDYFLAIHVLLFPFVLIGLVHGTNSLLARARFTAEKRERTLSYAFAALLILAVVSNVPRAWAPHQRIAERWTERLLTELPEGTALVTAGDADIYTIWYLQFARGERRDILAYGSNFVRFPWFRVTMNPDDPRRKAVGFASGSPGSADEFTRQLDSLVLMPLLERGDVYTTINDPLVIRMLRERDYVVEPQSRLLTDEEIDLLLSAGVVNLGPPLLFRVTHPAITPHTPDAR